MSLRERAGSGSLDRGFACFGARGGGLDEVSRRIGEQ